METISPDPPGNKHDPLCSPPFSPDLNSKLDFPLYGHLSSYQQSPEWRQASMLLSILCDKRNIDERNCRSGHDSFMTALPAVFPPTQGLDTLEDNEFLVSVTDLYRGFLLGTNVWTQAQSPVHGTARLSGETLDPAAVGKVGMNYSAEYLAKTKTIRKEDFSIKSPILRGAQSGQSSRSLLNTHILGKEQYFPGPDDDHAGQALLDTDQRKSPDASLSHLLSSQEVDGSLVRAYPPTNKPTSWTTDSRPSSHDVFVVISKPGLTEKLTRAQLCQIACMTGLGFVMVAAIVLWVLSPTLF